MFVRFTRSREGILNFERGSLRWDFQLGQTDNFNSFHLEYVL
jgi:hypothetical protein